MNVQNLVVSSIAILVVGTIGFKGIDALKQSSSYITTNGLSDRYVISDSVIWTIRIDTEANNIKEAQEKMKKDTAAVLNFLEDEGVKNEEIISRNSQMYDRYRWDSGAAKNAIPRFGASDTITIKTNRLEQIEQTKNKTTELLEQGINIDNNFRYYYKDIEKLRIDMIKEATLDSEERAKNIAESLGTQITGIRNLSTGRFAIYPEDQAITHDYANEWDEEHSKKKRIRVIVSGTYNLKL